MLAGPSEANKLSGSALPFSAAARETRKAHTHTSRWRPSKSCVRARARMYLRKTGFRPTALFGTNDDDDFGCLKSPSFPPPPFDIVARGVVSTIQESKYSFLFCRC